MVSEVVTLIGNGTRGFAKPGSYTSDTAINEPFGVTIGPDGCLYFCDIGSHRILSLDLDAEILTVVAGTGVAGYTGDGGPAVEAQCVEPYEIRFDTDGMLYFVDMKAHVVRRIDIDGRISTVAGNGVAGFSGDGGPAELARLAQPHSIEISQDDQSLLICDIGNHRVRRVELATGKIETWAGNGEETLPEAGLDLTATGFFGPRTMAFDEFGDLHLALREGNALYRIDADGRNFERYAGNGKFGYRGDGAAALDARLCGPKGLSVAGGVSYFADTESHTIRCVGTDGEINTLVGNGELGDGPDGYPGECRLARPHGVCLDPEGHLYIGDSENHRIRRLRVGEID